MRAAVFANGELRHPDLDRAHLRADDWLIAANGGYHHCQRLGLRPTTLIGDLDSLDPAEVEALRAQGTELIQHPTRKDQTDLELALQLTAERGAEEVLVFGALGARWDQTLSNLLLPVLPGLRSLRLRLLDGPQEILPLWGSRTLDLVGSPGDTVSLIPLAGDAVGVTTYGLEYPLQEGRLSFGRTLGVSNVLTGSSGAVSLREGMLLCLITHQGSGVM